MLFHTVKPGETVHDIASFYGFSPTRLIEDNGLYPPYRMIPGEVLVIGIPEMFHTVKGGEKFDGLCARYHIDAEEMLCANPVLGGERRIYPGQVLSVRARPLPPAALLGFTSGSVHPRELHPYLPYLTYLAVQKGNASEAQVSRVAAEARKYGVLPLKEENGDYIPIEATEETACRIVTTEKAETECDGVLCKTASEAAGIRSRKCFLSLALGYTADGTETDDAIPEGWLKTLSHTGEEIRREDGKSVFTVHYHLGGKALSHRVEFHDAERKKADLTRWCEEGFRGFYIGNLAAFTPKMRCVYASVFRPIKIREDGKTCGCSPT